MHIEKEIWGKGGQSTHDEGMQRDTEGIILGDNPAGHCFVLWDLVPRSFLNKL